MIHNQSLLGNVANAPSPELDVLRMKKGRHKLAKASGGCCHFADVSIQVSSTSAETKIIDNSGAEFDMVKGAIFGIDLELQRLKENKKVVIEKIETTIADSTPEKVAYSAILAIRDALSIDEQSYPKFEGREIRFERN